MEQKLERVSEHFYRRRYETAEGESRTKFYAIFTDWKGTRRRFPLGSDERSAKQALLLYEADNVKRVDFDQEKRQREEEQNRLTLSQWGKIYFEEMIEPGKASRGWQQLMFKKLESRLGDLLLEEIDEDTIDNYRDGRLRDPVTKHKKPLKGTRVAFSTVNRELAILRILLRLAKRRKKIKAVPDFNLQSEKSRKRTRTASADEYQALLSKMERQYQRPLIGLYETAMRANELLKLTWPKVDEKAGFIRLKPADVKEKMPRSVPISAALQTVLAELRAEQKQSKIVDLSGRVFTRRDGKPIKSLRKPFERACNDAQIEDLHLHDFRHTCITRWEMEGKPVGAIMAASGHHSLEMHNSYVNVNEHHLKAAFSVNVVLTRKNDEQSVEEKTQASY
jgi:integrase